MTACFSGRHRLAWLALLLASATLLASCLDFSQPAQTRYLTDAQGRALILHGVNVSSSAKHSADHQPFIDEAYVERSATDWGFNYVRYLVFWGAIEPEKGIYDEAYLNEVEKRVKWYTDRGVHVVIDMHQDVYGYGVGGNGAPAWATETDGVAYTPWSVGQFWWLENLNPAIINAFKNFWAYDRHQYLQDHYIAAYQHLVQRFANTPGVLGYDLMNEPHPGDLGKAIDGSFQRDWLAQFYRRLIPALRQVEPNKYLFFEPQSFGINFGMPAALPKIEDSRVGPPKLVYAPHIYPLFLHEGAAYSDIDRSQMRDWSKHRAAELDLQQTPMVVGEIGGSDSTAGFGQFTDDVMAMMDHMGAGWAWWSADPGSWGLTDGQGNEMPKTARLVRTYPRAIAGEPIEFKFVAGAADFSLRFQDKAGVTGPTEIFVPKRHYPDGWQLEVSDAPGSWSSSYDERSQVLRLWTPTTGGEHRVRIHRQFQNIYLPQLGKCLETDTGYTGNGTRATVGECTGRNTQGWIIASDSTLHNGAAPGQCLDVNGAMTYNANKVQLWQCNGSNAQKWTWDNGLLRSALNWNKCLDVAYGGDSTVMQLWDCQGGAAQTFAQRAVTVHQYKPLKNEASGLCLDINGGSMSNGTAVIAWSCHSGANQQWRFEPSTGFVHSQKDPRYCLDNRGATGAGAAWGIWRCTDSNNLRFFWTGNTWRPYHNLDLVMQADGTGNGAAIKQQAGDGSAPLARWLMP